MLPPCNPAREPAPWTPANALRKRLACLLCLQLLLPPSRRKKKFKKSLQHSMYFHLLIKSQQYLITHENYLVSLLSTIVALSYGGHHFFGYPIGSSFLPLPMPVALLLCNQATCYGGISVTQLHPYTIALCTYYWMIALWRMLLLFYLH